MSSVKAFDPSYQARRDPYYKRNHMGRVTCTLCDICCTDDNNFLKHLVGKTHRAQLERIERNARREERLAAEEELNREAIHRAEQEKAAREKLLLLQQQQQQQSTTLSSSSSSSAANCRAAAGAPFAPFGKPQFSFTTEHDPGLYQTKVWLEFYFPQAEEGARPLHRWRSAREQEVERPPDDSVVYLLVACEGYVTIAMKFPAKLARTTGSVGVGYGGEEEGKYHCSWDPLKRVYSLFFILG